MKTPEELNAIKAEVEAVNKNLANLNEEELEQVSGGTEVLWPIEFTAGQRINLMEITPDYVDMYVIVKRTTLASCGNDRVPVTLHRRYLRLGSLCEGEIETDYSAIELYNAQSRQ